MKFYPLKGLPNYSISRCGKVRNDVRGKLLSSFLDVAGYYRVGIGPAATQKIFSLHRLLALTFIPNPLNKRTVNHKNGDKLDNRIENLEWATHAENTQHAHATGLVRVRKGSDARAAKLSWDEVKQVRALKGKFSQREIGEIFGVTRSCIQAIHSGWSWIEE